MLSLFVSHAALPFSSIREQQYQVEMQKETLLVEVEHSATQRVLDPISQSLDAAEGLAATRAHDARAHSLWLGHGHGVSRPERLLRC